MKVEGKVYGKRKRITEKGRGTREGHGVVKWSKYVI
jgi:hypothetical protein